MTAPPGVEICAGEALYGRAGSEARRIGVTAAVATTVVPAAAAMAPAAVAVALTSATLTRATLGESGGG